MWCWYTVCNANHLFIIPGESLRSWHTTLTDCPGGVNQKKVYWLVLYFSTVLKLYYMYRVVSCLEKFLDFCSRQTEKYQNEDPLCSSGCQCVSEPYSMVATGRGNFCFIEAVINMIYWDIKYVCAMTVPPVLLLSQVKLYSYSVILHKTNKPEGV